jgi:hypothetical protein
MAVRFEVFRSSMFDTWEVLFAQAADYASKLGPHRLVGISHSQEGSAGVVTVWYWSEEPPDA